MKSVIGMLTAAGVAVVLTGCGDDDAGNNTTTAAAATGACSGVGDYYYKLENFITKSSFKTSKFVILIKFLQLFSKNY